MAKEPKAEQKESRYGIYRTADEGAHLERLGAVLATSSDQALRKFFAEPHQVADGPECLYVAVSENACRLRAVRAETQVRMRFDTPAP